MPKYHVLLDDELGQKLTGEATAVGLNLSTYVRLILRGSKVSKPPNPQRNNKGRFEKARGTSCTSASNT
jgi:hypothetical protein